MMKYQSLVIGVLAAYLAAPNLMPQDDDLALLEGALHETEVTLGVLKELESRIDSRDDAAVDLIVSATETPSLTEEALDDRLGTLRRQVSLLRMELDALETPDLVTATRPQTTIVVRPTIGVTTGMDESIRGVLRRSLRPQAVGEARPSTLGVGAATRTPIQPGKTPSGNYSADVLGQAQASYHARRYEDTIELLAGREDSDARYWTARSLTRLNRYDEAIGLLQKIVEAEGESYAGRRAHNDLEFVRWKQEFADKLPKGLKEEK